MQATSFQREHGRKPSLSPTRREGEPLWMKLRSDADLLQQQPATSTEVLFAMGHLADVLLDVIRDPEVEQVRTFSITHSPPPHPNDRHTKSWTTHRYATSVSSPSLPSKAMR